MGYNIKPCYMKKDDYQKYVKGPGEKDGLHVNRKEFHSRKKEVASKMGKKIPTWDEINSVKPDTTGYGTTKEHKKKWDKFYKTGRK